MINKGPSKCPRSHWLLGFFEAIKQNHSRESDVPVEDVSIKFDDIAHFEKELQVWKVLKFVKEHLARK